MYFVTCTVCIFSQVDRPLLRKLQYSIVLNRCLVVMNIHKCLNSLSDLTDNDNSMR